MRLLLCSYPESALRARFPESRRIVDRQGLSPAGGSGYQDYQALFLSSLEPDAAVFGEYHALLVKLAKDVCRQKPRCSFCCLADECLRKSVQ